MVTLAFGIINSLRKKLKKITWQCPDFVCLHIKSVKRMWTRLEIRGANWNLASRFDPKDKKNMNHMLQQMVGQTCIWNNDINITYLYVTFIQIQFAYDHHHYSDKTDEFCHS
ncbi:LOW QUALITY PROTEIN: uncharacterized protein LOC108870143 [Brassica rapa]|uniref:LOW QUALITY PROTEIN: uncharacterized protein LOC108870143 n=1 Tax=Brassica campestris TaxID=3711 RepID=UPI00142E3071|nr:LOW QUALITY PROTEIN: uncharacterized protein LOC108870143 [Brassica rapa]